VACPFFLPTGPFQDSSWATPPRLPLGEACRGVCRTGDDLFEPAENILRSFCNRGYGKYGCPRFPANAAADALRYSLESDRDGVLVIQYIYEHEYGPVRHGRLEYRAGVMEGELDDPVARAQALMFAEGLVKRKATA